MVATGVRSALAGRWRSLVVAAAGGLCFLAAGYTSWQWTTPQSGLATVREVLAPCILKVFERQIKPFYGSTLR